MCVYACTSVCQLWWLLQKCLYTAITYDNKTGHQWFAMHSRGKGWQHQSFFVPVRAAHSLKSHHSPCKQLMLFTKLGTLTTFRIDITLIGAVAKLCSSTKLFECSVLNLCFFFFFHFTSLADNVARAYQLVNSCCTYLLQCSFMTSNLHFL